MACLVAVLDRQGLAGLENYHVGCELAVFVIQDWVLAGDLGVGIRLGGIERLGSGKMMMSRMPLFLALITSESDSI